tara:strand:+ start:3372 stop:3941 length:570 start_codon:yes stop_codon:yes gene_type:complete
MKLPSLMSLIKKTLYSSILILFGIIIQNRFDVMEGIIDLENRFFHEEEYDFVMKVLPVGSSNNIMGVRGQVLYSFENYKAELLIPKEYRVNNKTPQKGVLERDGYHTYFLKSFVKKYRDLCSYDGLVITPESPDISKQPVIVAVLSGSDIRYMSETYSIETKNKKVVLTKLDDGKGKKQKKNRCIKSRL